MLAIEGRRNPEGVEADFEFDTQGSRDGNPGLEVANASRYLIRASLSRLLSIWSHDNPDELKVGTLNTAETKRCKLNR